MPIEITCSNCQAILRVADEHAGKSARCPQCSTVMPIPLTPLPPENAWQETPTQYQSPQAQSHAAEDSNPYASPRAGSTTSLVAHRGFLILILGIASIPCCGLIGIPAIIMANEDLRKIDAGIMNPEGRGLTTAGKILGIIGLIVLAIGIIGNVIFAGAAAVAPGF